MTGVPSNVDRFGVKLGSTALFGAVIALYPSDPTLDLEIQRATDANGTGAVSIGTVSSADAYYIDPLPNDGVARYYRCRHVADDVQPSAWTGWVAASPRYLRGGWTLPQPIRPVIREQPSEASNVGKLTLVVNDPQSRVVSVQAKTKSGQGNESAYANMTTSDGVSYTATVAMVEKHVSRVVYQVTGYDERAQLVTLAEGVVPFGIGSIPLAPTVALTFDASGSVSAVVTGDSDTTGHKLAASTSGYPTAAAVRATATLSGRVVTLANILTLSVGQSAYVSVIAYNGAVESVLVNAVITRANATSAPTANISLVSEIQASVTIALEGSLGGGSAGPLQWRTTTSTGTAQGTPTAWSTTALPQNMIVSRAAIQDKFVKLEVQQPDGQVAKATFPILPKIAMFDFTTGVPKRGTAWDDGGYPAVATDTSGFLLHGSIKDGTGVPRLLTTMFQRNADTLDYVLDSASWQRAASAYVDTSGRIRYLYDATRASVVTTDDVNDGRIRAVNAIDTSNRVRRANGFDDGNYAASAVNAVGTVLHPNAGDSGSRALTSLFQRSVDALSLVLDDASFKKTAAGYIDGSNRIVNLYSAGDAALLSGSNAYDGVQRAWSAIRDRAGTFTANAKDFGSRALTSMFQRSVDSLDLILDSANYQRIAAGFVSAHMPLVDFSSPLHSNKYAQYLPRTATDARPVSDLTSRLLGNGNADTPFGDSGNRALTSMFQRSVDSLDSVLDSASYGKTTPTQVAGAGRGYTALDASGALVSRVAGGALIGNGGNLTAQRMTGRVSGMNVCVNPTFSDASGGSVSYYLPYDNASTGRISLISSMRGDNPAGQYSMNVHVAAGSSATSPSMGGFFVVSPYGGTLTEYPVPRPGSCRPSAEYLVHAWMLIPVGYTLSLAANTYGSGGNWEALSDLTGTGAWKEYTIRVYTGTAGSIGSTPWGYFYLSGPSTTGVLDWWVGSLDIIDMAATPLLSTGNALRASNGNHLKDADVVTSDPDAKDNNSRSLTSLFQRSVDTLDYVLDSSSYQRIQAGFVSNHLPTALYDAAYGAAVSVSGTGGIRDGVNRSCSGLDTNARVADQTKLQMLTVGGPVAKIFNSSDQVLTNVLHYNGTYVNTDAFRLRIGSAGYVSYNARSSLIPSANPSTPTRNYVYFVDPTYAGGSPAAYVTTSVAELYTNDGIIYLGYIDCQTGTSGGGTGCPSPETPILLADGSEVPAGELRPGMVLRTRHEDTLAWGEFEVRAVSIHQAALRTLTLEGGRSLTATPNHRVHTIEGWRCLRDLKRGDFVTTERGWARVLSLDAAPAGWAVAISVDGAHTYISAGILSHNVKPFQ